MRSDEEQIQLVKNWWKENGTSLLIGVGLALAIVFGWKAWQQHEAEQKYTASLLYQQALELVAAATQPNAPETQRATAEFKIDELQKQFPDTAYAQLGQLLKARLLMDQDKAAEAESVLNGLAAKVTDPGIRTLIKGRIALALAAQDKLEEALAQLDAASDSPYYPQQQELRGDILKMKGDRAGARQAYEAARDALNKAGFSTQLVDLKLEDLADA